MKEIPWTLVVVKEIIPNNSLVQIVLDGLPDSYQSFASTLRLLMKGNLNSICFTS